MVEAAGEDYDSSDIGDGIKIGPDLHNGVTDSSSLSWGGLNLQYLRPTRLYTRLKHSIILKHRDLIELDRNITEISYHRDTP